MANEVVVRVAPQSLAVGYQVLSGELKYLVSVTPVLLQIL